MRHKDFAELPCEISFSVEPAPDVKIGDWKRQKTLPLHCQDDLACELLRHGQGLFPIMDFNG
jgi:hypothetical protein